MGRKVEAILTSKAARQAAEKAVEAWPYAFKSYDLESRIQAPGGPAESNEGESYRVSKTVRVVQQNGRPILTDGKQRVEVPGEVASQVRFIMGRETVSAAVLKSRFPEMSEAAVADLIRSEEHTSELQSLIRL